MQNQRRFCHIVRAHLPTRTDLSPDLFPFAAIFLNETKNVKRERRATPVCPALTLPLPLPPTLLPVPSVHASNGDSPLFSPLTRLLDAEWIRLRIRPSCR